MAGKAPKCTPRTGFVTLQFDDSNDLHYRQVFPLLEQHNLKASFGYVTESSDLGIEHSAWRMRVIANAGHEIQDHTTRHDYRWATHVDTLDDGVHDLIQWTFVDSTAWDSLCGRSLFILDSLGIDVVGWNHPGGGPGCGPDRPSWVWRGLQNDTLNRVIGRRYPYALGSNVFANTAHLNLRGHNHPDRWPFFNVPHVAIDYLGFDEIKTGIADAVASGLWYLAAGHAQDMAQIAKLDSLLDWLTETDIEVLRCVEGWQRIEFGVADPWANQLPQGRMQVDLDGNGKPDGFTGECAWDTVSAPPVAGVGCLRVFGDADFYCYGPEVGTNHLSFWLRSATTPPVFVTIWELDYDFDWDISECSMAEVDATYEWTQVDSCLSTALVMEIGSEVDRVLFRLHVAQGDTALIADPKYLLVASAGLDAPEEGHLSANAWHVTPNPVRHGRAFRVGAGGRVTLYNILGQEVGTYVPDLPEADVTIETSPLGRGMYFIDATEDGRHAKVIVY